MNDTHGQTGQGWYGFDLDGTLAVYTEWKGIGHIGAPVKPMVDLIKKMHDEGKVVKILTARVAPRDHIEYVENPYHGKEMPPWACLVPVFKDSRRFYALRRWMARDFIIDWCAHHLGFVPEITHEKDQLMLELYDDRVKQVIPNKGILLEDLVNGFKRNDGGDE